LLIGCQNGTICAATKRALETLFQGAKKQSNMRCYLSTSD